MMGYNNKTSDKSLSNYGRTGIPLSSGNAKKKMSYGKKK